MISKITRKIRSLWYQLRASYASLPDRYTIDVPYRSQFANPENVEECIREHTKCLEDPLWKDTGASTPEHYKEWAFTMCGMACLAMVLEHYSGTKKKIVEMAEEGVRRGVYKRENGEISSMHYEPFAEMVQSEYELTAHVLSPLTLKGICYALARDTLVIASVNPNIRGKESVPVTQVGGHLVLVTGYDRNKKVVYIHNPSGYEINSSQKFHEVSWDEFQRHFANRGIIISK